MRDVVPYLRLVRAGTLFSPAADVIAGLCLVEQPWSFAALRTVLASVLLYAAGMILNDHADRAEDARLRPERPIPRGDVSPGRAAALGTACLAACLALSPIRGYHGAMAVLVLGYDYLLKHQVAVGAVTMGCLRALNILAPTALVEAVPDWRRAVLVGGAYGIYIVAVTLLGVLEDARIVGRRTVLGLVSLPPIVGALAVYALPDAWPASGVGFALAIVLLWRHREGDWDQRRIRGAMLWLLLGTMVYTSLVALGMGRIVESLVIAGMIVPARVIARWIAVT